MTHTWLSLLIFAFCALMVGCLSPSDSSTPSSATLSATVGSSSSPADGSPVGTAAADLIGCVDAVGQPHAEGDTWGQTLPHSFAKCGDAEQYTAQQETRGFVCQDGKVWTATDQIVPLQVSATCPAAQLSATIDSGTLNVSSSNVTAVTYTCVGEAGNSLTLAGSVASGSQSVAIDPSKTWACTVAATDVLGATLTATVEQDGNCGNRIKVNGTCQDFVCKQFLAIAPDASGLLRVPARTVEGQCFAMKIFNAIPNSPSSLATSSDGEVLSRNHDSGGGGYTNSGALNVHNPYLMGKALINFAISGPRTIKLAGSGDSLAPILVDNFVISGIYPMGLTNPAASSYRAFGTSDSSIGTTGAVTFNGTPVAIQAFGSGGTSTVAPLDITTQVTANHPFSLDVRAEDCGGSRELSNLYIVFQ